jgi:hypothetical protein
MTRITKIYVVCFTQVIPLFSESHQAVQQLAIASQANCRNFPPRLIAEYCVSERSNFSKPTDGIGSGTVRILILPLWQIVSKTPTSTAAFQQLLMRGNLGFEDAL